MSDKPKCCKMKWISDCFRGRSAQCEHAGKVERAGKWYCGIHDPEKNKERDRLADEKAQEARQARVTAEQRARLTEECHDELRDALCAMVEMCQMGRPKSRIMNRAITILAKAKGEA